MEIRTYYHDDRGYASIPCKEVKRLKFKNHILNHAGVSLYRMNAKTADCYAFSYYKNEEGKDDWQGGWDWTNDFVDKDAEYLVLLADTSKFYKILWPEENEESKD